MKIHFFAFVLVSFFLLLPGCESLDPPTAFDQSTPATADTYQLSRVSHDDIIPNEYIVVLADNSSDVKGMAAAMANEHAASVKHLFRYSIKGFSARMSATAAEKLAKNPNVKYVEPNRLFQLAPPSGKSKPGSDDPPPAQIVPWGIQRVGGFVSYTGNGRAWVIDSGIDMNNADLNVDAARSISFVPAKGKSLPSPQDENGHGTHVAGTIAAIDNAINVVGVAAGAPVVAVRVLDRTGSGQYDWIIAGIDYVAANGASGDVANMSLGGGFSQAVNDAVIAASTNIKFALAAGNEGTDAATRSPASANGANIYTISAHNSADIFASFSNYGNPPVDYAAPGVAIESLDMKTGGVVSWNGTSMAAPHVAGILLLGPVSADGRVIDDPDGNPDIIAHR